MALFSVYRFLSPVEKYLAGYKPEHFYFGIQVLVAFILGMLPLTINYFFNHLSGTNTIWTVVTIAVVMEPNMGGALRKGALRALGAIIGGLLGILALVIADQISHHQYSLMSGGAEGLGPVAIGCLSATGFLIAVHKQRFTQIDHFFFVMLFTVPVVVGQGIRDQELSVQHALRRILNVLIGVAIATLVSVIVFPIRARLLLQRDTASMLIRIGDLGVWVLNQVCVVPNADGTLPGITCTDSSMTYCDDGVEAKLRPLHDAVHRIWRELAELNTLLLAADKEWYMFHKPRVFPTQQYTTLLRACAVVLGLLQSLLYWLQSTMANMGLVHNHMGEVRELTVQLSSSLTALSWLVHTPKAMKKGKRGWLGKVLGLFKFRRRSAAHVATVTVDAPNGREPSEAHRGVAFTEMPIDKEECLEPKRAGSSTSLPRRRRDNASNSGVQESVLPSSFLVRQQQGDQGYGRHSDTDRVNHHNSHDGDLEAPAPVVEDDPFAELAAAQLASHHAEMPTPTLQQAGHTASCSSAVDGSAGLPTPFAAPAEEKIFGKSSPSSTSQEGCEEVQPQQRQQQQHQEGVAESESQLGDLALTKLLAMAAAVKRLVAVLELERLEASAERFSRLHPTEDLARNIPPAGSLRCAAAIDTLWVVVNTTTGLGRQLAAMFTALDPKRARHLHSYVVVAVKEVETLKTKHQDRKAL